MSYSPEFIGPIQGYVVNHMRKNFWRVERTQSREDVMQEASVVFLRCKQKYQDLETPQHFMALFKRAWSNHFTDMSNADTQSRVLVPQQVQRSDDGSETIADIVGDLDNDGALAIRLRQAPPEVILVLNLFLSAPQEILDLALGSWKGRDQRCKTGGSKRICKMLGLPPELDVIKVVEEYFTN